jgi:hypothetical protein
VFANFIQHAGEVDHTGRFLIGGDRRGVHRGVWLM